MEFLKFGNAVRKQLDKLISLGLQLYIVDVNGNLVWDKYLDAFPEGTNEIFKERREYDCVHCKQFIKPFGNIVAIQNNELVSIWDIAPLGDEFAAYQTVAEELSKFVKSHPIKTIFIGKEKKLGVEFNHQLLPDTTVRKWNHFSYELPNALINKSADSVESIAGTTRTTKKVFKRSLDELTTDAVDTTIDLIIQNSLYRGEEHLHAVEEFQKYQTDYNNLADENAKDNFCWSNIPNASARIRNTAIGTFLINLSDGMELDMAVTAFEKVMAPANYKRPKPIFTKGMVEAAEKKIEELGLGDSLARRFSTIDDVTINNVLFANRDAKTAMSVFDKMKEDIPAEIKSFSKVDEVPINTFITDILPKANSIKVLFENKHVNNLMSLISPQDKDAPSILKWDNNFSWTYNGNVTDSLKEQVRLAGGRVDGVFRFSHTWNYDGKNQSLMDLHVFMPGNPHIYTKTTHNAYGSGRRVGWNHRNDTQSGGVQDVDFVDEPGTQVPVENITFPKLAKMPDGKYICKIHNWNLRRTTSSGFKAEIEFEGNVYQYEYPKALGHKEWITVAEVTLKDGCFTIEHKLDEAHSSVEVWNVNTNKFQEVSLMTVSPNHWDNNQSGNKHHFFIMKDCLNPSTPNAFYNEYLKNDLTEHRKVFEALASNMKVDKSIDQLSGLGFSTTSKNSLICKVEGSFSRTIKIII